MPLDEIIFFETESKEVRAHTRNDMFETEYKLYELEIQDELANACLALHQALKRKKRTRKEEKND